VCLIFQIVSGILLSLHFVPSREAFINVDFISREVNNGWLIRYFHANGASVFFFLIYIHILRGIFFKSYKLRKVWSVGVIIFLITILVAFLGYVLPWGQMRFWAATVITNLVRAVPFFGQLAVEWLWGGFGVSLATLNRFYSFHFLLPFILLGLIIVHLIYLHENLSNNPLGLKRKIDFLDFHPFFSAKDLFGFILIFLFYAYLSLFWPTIFIDPENFLPSNPIRTPTHIKPEWYFLPFYAVLRALPNKLGGVILILAIIFLLLIIPAFRNLKRASIFRLNLKLLKRLLLTLTILLFWVGIRPVVFPYDYLGKVIVLLYFLLFSFVFIIY
jgi:ubiquinol-cytochrome c reductase cytochrome b subunit